MNHKQNILFLLLSAILLTALGYIIDSDEAYQQWTQTTKEFSVICLFIFAIESAAYGLLITVRTFISNR